jgi:hypothetical protein
MSLLQISGSSMYFYFPVFRNPSTQALPHLKKKKKKTKHPWAKQNPGAGQRRPGGDRYHFGSRALL